MSGPQPESRPPRIVFHYDLDAFFAAVEVLGNPSLEGRPLVIGGMPGDRGVVSTASYEARTHGVRAGMPLGEAARLCPQAIFIPCRPAPYVWHSTRVLKLFLEYTPRVEQFSIDEVFIEGGDLGRDWESALTWAARTQEQIARRLRLWGTVHLKLRWSDFTTTVRQSSLDEPTDASAVLLRHARALFRRFDLGGAVRMLGLAVSSLTPAAKRTSPRVSSIFAADHRAWSVQSAADRVRDRFGDQIPRPAAGLPS